MRRVDAEVDSRGVRVPKRAEDRSRSRLRQAALEWLERRELLSTLPAPVAQGQSLVGLSDSGLGNSSSPSVAVDPFNPEKLVSAWVTYDPGNKLDGSTGQVTTYVQGAYSIDGGTTWQELPNDMVADVQNDFSIAPSTSGPQPNFSQTTDATVAFGRDETAYLLTSTHNTATGLTTSASGVIDLQKWNFSGATPASVEFNIPAYDSLSQDGPGFDPQTGMDLLNPVYRWQAVDGAITPTLAVDNNVPNASNFDGGSTAQNDPFAGNVYVAWETNDAAPKGVTLYNPNTIKLLSSGNKGQDFTYQAYLSGQSFHGYGSTYDQPKIAISQGGPGVPAGQVSIVFDNAGQPINGTAPYVDNIFNQNDTNGGTDAHGDSPIDVGINNAPVGSPSQETGTAIPINVPASAFDSNFTSLANLTITLSIQYPNLSDTAAFLTSPDGSITATLWNNATDVTGAATNFFGTLAGANLGRSTLTPYIGTTLDSTAFRSLFDGNVTAPYTGHFRPAENLQTAFRSLPVSSLAGNWTLTIVTFQNQAPATPPVPLAVVGASIDLTSGLSSVTNTSATFITNSFLNSGLQQYTDAIQAVPVFAAPAIASDNTLGTHSAHQGRLYVAFTNDDINIATLAPTNSTFIQLFISDNGGRSWRPDTTDAITKVVDGIVNDDNGQADGFSTGGFAQPNSGIFADNLEFNGEANVRPKMQPEVAVDPQTGTLVVSFLDTRNDASEQRVATYVAISSDGGSSFSPETYANESNPFDSRDANGFGIPTITINAITGQPVNLGPVPENQSAANPNRDATFGFGGRQGLAVADGHIFPIWSSNQNGTTVYEPRAVQTGATGVGATLFSNAGSSLRNEKTILNIESAVLTFAAGPRVISSTQGVVGEPGDSVNASKAADGTPIANTIVLTFDKAVDPLTFPTDGATIGASPLQVFYNNPNGAAPVPLRVTNVIHDPTDTVYTVTFDPAGSGVGTYTYTLLPLVRGQIPYQTTLGTASTAQIPFIDSGSSTPSASFTVSGHPGIVLDTANLSAVVDIYQKGTSTGSPTDLQVFLVAADGTTYTLFSGTTLGQAANVAFDVSGTIAIPAIPQELLDQTYTIRVVDNVPGEKVFLFNDIDAEDFNFQVTVANEAGTGVTGNLLDQNANGTVGEATLDDYSVPNGRNSLPLIVPGPHVVNPTPGVPTSSGGVSVTGVKGVVSTGADSLVNEDNANSVNVTFDRTIRVDGPVFNSTTGAFTPADILSIVGPTGRIDGPQTFLSTGTSKVYPYNGSYELIPKATTTTVGTVVTTVPGTLVSPISIANTGLNVSSLTVQLNITDPNDASLQVVLVAPDGTTVPLVLAGSATGANFTNTTFSDIPALNGLTSTIPLAKAPYGLTYTPASPLSALMGKPLDGIWKLMITDNTLVGTPQGRLNAWSLNVTPLVPKGAGTELDSTLAIPAYADGSFLISHLAVQLNISATKDSDLQIYLKSPNGTIVPLVYALPVNGTDMNFSSTTFDDNASITLFGANPVGGGTAPYSLAYKPYSPLGVLDGKSISGNWTLIIKNPNADASVTTLNAWSLIATPTITVTPVAPVVNGGASTFKVGFPTQTLSGTYTVTLSPNIESVTPNPANPAMGTPLDSNLNAGVYELQGITSGVTTTATYPATAVPVPIPYAKTSPIGPIIDGVLKSQLNVPDNFAIQGDVGGLAGLTVSLNISYYNDPDLTATLTAPDGVSVTLFSMVGTGANAFNFTNTTLSDTVTPLAPITTAGAPFFGTFNPENPLSAFTTDALGNQAFSQGLWTLTINNVGKDPGATIDAAHPPQLISWSLAFQRPQTSTGLGEPVADQKTVSFRLFNAAPTNTLANDTWTAVGPAGTTNLGDSLNGNPGGVNLAGPVSVVALDPTDPSGNTAYIGASSGGIWKTTDFLTTNAAGPTYIPLTDFGTNYSINIGGIAIFDRNNDPTQSIIFAGTGDGQAVTANAGNAAQGVGFLRSINGGASFTLLDSSTNVDGNGNPLPVNSPLRDHIFVGTTTYKIIVDPTTAPGGGVIVYAALGGKNGGLWRTTDEGNHWTNLSAGVIPQLNGQNAAATDVLFDPVSASTSTGNIDIIYAAFQGVGVFISGNQGQSLTEVLGNVGATNLIRNTAVAPAQPLAVNDQSPNGAFGRIILSKPALTNSVTQNILYQDWLYAAVENVNGTFNGLYITKDRGENWTKVQIADVPTPAANNAITQALPTNDNTVTNNYDVTNPTGGNGSGGGFNIQNGNSTFSMTVDPLNPNIIYLGGTQDYQSSGLIRVDITGIYDAHAFVPFASNRNDGGKLARDATGRVNVQTPTFIDPIFEGTNPSNPADLTGEYYTNLRHSPTDPFNVNASLFVFNSSNFTSDGTGVTWSPIDINYGTSPLGSNELHYASPLDGTTEIHQIVSLVDPLTGLSRLIFSDNQGVFTGVYNADGSLSTSGIGTQATVTGSRNGNIQDEQLYYSAAQPSPLAAATAGALFYGSGIGLTDAQSTSDLLSTGDLTWVVAGTAYGDVQNIIGTNDRGGTGIATDPTGGITTSNPNGKPSLYEYDVPLLGGDTTNFFRVQNNGSTTGLTNNFNAQFPGTNVLSVGNGVTQLGNFTVNPINGSQILIGSNTGNVYESTNQGEQFLLIGAGQAIGTGQADFDGTYASALTYGAPDPGAPNGVGNLNNFIYVGTVGGNIYVTRTGGSPWTKLSAGLDGSSIVGIYTDPNRGTHDAYAITLTGVYYMANSTTAGAAWVNVTGNLTQIQHNSFGDPTLAQAALLPYANGQLGGFRSIVADFRYAVPDAVLPGVTYPVLYVAGYGGVFRSLDNGQTWTIFPNTAFDSAPVDGGYLPSVDVTSLSLNLGTINPATGHPQVINETATSTTAVSISQGGGSSLTLAFNANLDISSGYVTISLTNTSSAAGGKNIGDLIINLIGPGGQVFRLPTSAITATTLTAVQFQLPAAFLASTLSGTYTLAIANSTPGDTGTLTSFGVTLSPSSDEVLLASTLGRGDFAIRLAPVVFPTTIHFDANLPAPGGSDSGTSNSDRITSVLAPYIDGNSEISNFGTTVTITLTDASNNYVLGVGTTDQFGNFSIQLGSGLKDANGNALTQLQGLALIQAGDPTFFTSSLTLNDKVVGIQATDSSGASGNLTDFAYTLILKTGTSPATPSAPVLQPLYDTGRSNSDDITNIEVPAPTPGSMPVYSIPLFNVTTVTPPSALPSATTDQLLRAISPTGPFTVVSSVVGNGGVIVLSDPSLQALAQAGTLNGIYYYEADEIDVAGNMSAMSPVLAVTVTTVIPPTLPAPTLDPSSNTGLVPGSLNTNVPNPVFDATNVLAGDQLLLYRSSNGATAILVGSGALGGTRVADFGGGTAAAPKPVPNGVYQYFVVQQDIAGNVSNFSQPITINVNRTVPTAPTIMLLASDDTGLPSHPNVTNVNMPHFTGTAPYNITTPLPVVIINAVTGAVLSAVTYPSANGTYLAQVASPLPDGTYTVEARTTNQAGNSSVSAPLTITISHNGPQIIPTLMLLPADDTGIKGDGTTANHNPHFIGTTDKGVTVSLYALINGVVVGPEATTTSSTISGAFSFTLPFSLTDGATTLYAQASDIAGNKGTRSPGYSVRILTTAGDYLASGTAQLSVFDPLSETLYIRGIGSVKVDSTPGRDVPVQYDFNGDGATDLSAYRFNTAEYYGYVSNNTILDQQYGAGGASLPVSGFFGNSGTFVYGSYQPSTGFWEVALPVPGGLVVQFGVPRVDVPTPAAFDGNNSTELAVFRPSTVAGNDADSYSVFGPTGAYQVSFTNPAVTKLGFVYKAGDLPAPADYDGIGKDEFAIYRPSTGQFFILKTPSVTNTATWTLRTVTLNLPGGPNANDVPASADYDGNGKVDPTVYRPANSTFYLIHSTTGLQENIQFGVGNQFVAAAGPVVYRLTALKGAFASTAGYIGSNGGGANAIGVGTTGGGVHALSIGSGTTTASSTSSPSATTIVVASPIPVAAPVVAPATPVSATSTPKALVTVGASTPKSAVLVLADSKATATTKAHSAKEKKAAHTSAVAAKPHATQARPHAVAVKTTPAHLSSKAATSHASTASSKNHEAIALALQHIVIIKKHRQED